MKKKRQTDKPENFYIIDIVGKDKQEAKSILFLKKNQVT